MENGEKGNLSYNSAKKTTNNYRKWINIPNLKNIRGDSVNEYKELEEANILITGDEIKQQNENL